MALGMNGRIYKTRQESDIELELADGPAAVGNSSACWKFVELQAIKGQGSK